MLPVILESAISHPQFLAQELAGMLSPESSSSEQVSFQLRRELEGFSREERPIQN